MYHNCSLIATYLNIIFSFNCVLNASLHFQSFFFSPSRNNNEQPFNLIPSTHVQNIAQYKTALSWLIQRAPNTIGAEKCQFSSNLWWTKCEMRSRIESLIAASVCFRAGKFPQKLGHLCDHLIPLSWNSVLSLFLD